MATVTETGPRSESRRALFVVEDFKDAHGHEWRAGDRAPLARFRRQTGRDRTARAVPVEWGTEALDPAADWFQEIEQELRGAYAR